MKVGSVFVKLKLISAVTVIFLLSCKTKNTKPSQDDYTKLISNFNPAFDESAEIIFSDSNSQKQLTLLIKKDFFRNVSSKNIQDTCYFKCINLNSSQTNLVYQTIFNFWDSLPTQKDIIILDGMHVTFNYIQKEDTSFVIYVNPSKSDTIAYRFNSAILNTYQSLFNDPIVTSYFNIIREYLGYSIKLTDVSAYRKLMVKNYPGQFQYDPQK